MSRPSVGLPERRALLGGNSDSVPTQPTSQRMALMCYARVSIAGYDGDDYLEDARRQLANWTKQGTALRIAGISPYDEKARALGYEPIDEKYSLHGVDQKKVLDPCKVTISATIKEATKRGFGSMIDFLNYGRM